LPDRTRRDLDGGEGSQNETGRAVHGNLVPSAGAGSPPACAGGDGGEIARSIDSLCLILELLSRLRELSDEPHEVGALMRDLGGNGRLDADSSADFLAALRELVKEGTRMLEMNDEMKEVR
jgi:hypothetical protein